MSQLKVRHSGTISLIIRDEVAHPQHPSFARVIELGRSCPILDHRASLYFWRSQV